jgi:histidine ammonia-lyase/phenylalanine ammonia-lyase
VTINEALLAQDEIGSAAVVIDGGRLTLPDIASVARGRASAILPTDATVGSRIDRSRRRELVESGTPVDGVTTGFGDSVHRYIDSKNAELHQERLIAFLGNGTGAPLPMPTASAVKLIRTNNLACGMRAIEGVAGTNPIWWHG